MHNDSPILDRAAILDRAEVEKIAYQAIGHQFRLPSLFSMLLLLVGFVMGHYVAARHTNDIAARFEERITSLQEKVSALELSGGVSTSRVLSRNSAECASPIHAGPVTTPFDTAAGDSAFRLAGMGRSFETADNQFAMVRGTTVAFTSETSKAQLEELRKEMQDERQACLTELAPYIERKLSVPVGIVVEVIETIYSDQEARISDALSDANTRATGIKSRDTSVKIFPPLGDGAADSAVASGERNFRYFPKPAAPRSMHFAPGGRPPLKTSLSETGTIVR